MIIMLYHNEQIPDVKVLEYGPKHVSLSSETEQNERLLWVMSYVTWLIWVYVKEVGLI